MLMEHDKENGEVVPCARAGDSGGAEEPKHEPGEEPDGQDEDQPGERPHVVVDNDVRLQRAHAQASWMGARTKPQVRCASGAGTLRWDAPRYVQEVEASSGPGPRCTPWQAACLAS